MKKLICLICIAFFLVPAASAQYASSVRFGTASTHLTNDYFDKLSLFSPEYNTTAYPFGDFIVQIPVPLSPYEVYVDDKDQVVSIIFTDVHQELEFFDIILVRYDESSPRDSYSSSGENIVKLSQYQHSPHHHEYRRADECIALIEYRYSSDNRLSIVVVHILNGRGAILICIKPDSIDIPSNNLQERTDFYLDTILKSITAKEFK